MNKMIFDEADYLASNPDVAAAVNGGVFQSGLQHYQEYEIYENRSWGINSRKGKALFAIDKDGLGLEIGPSHNPIASKKMGYNVHILDHLDAAGLRKKYANHNVNIENIEDVDFVWQGQSLHELIGKESHYNWIIASHVIEHVPDFISFLQQCEKILTPTGIISLIIPDKRYCFDYFNSISLTDVFLDAYREKRTRPSSGQIFAELSNASKRNGHIAWNSSVNDKIELVHSFKYASETWKQVIASEEYFDVHCWRFTPDSFRLVMKDLHLLGLINLSICAEFETVGSEFFATLHKSLPAQNSDDRFEMLMKLQSN